MLYDFDFDWRHMVRGLTIDKRRGNVLKLDRHKYVKLAYHGFQKLTREQRLATYANALVRSSHTYLLNQSNSNQAPLLSRLWTHAECSCRGCIGSASRHGIYRGCISKTSCRSSYRGCTAKHHDYGSCQG